MSQSEDRQNADNVLDNFEISFLSKHLIIHLIFCFLQFKTPCLLSVRFLIIFGAIIINIYLFLMIIHFMFNNNYSLATLHFSKLKPFALFCIANIKL